MRVIQQDKHRINKKITSEELRLVGDNVEIGVYKLSQALAIANEQNLDLVEISPKAVPPVCKVMDYKKFLYEQKKREKALKSKAAKVVVKEIRFGPNTDADGSDSSTDVVANEVSPINRAALHPHIQTCTHALKRG